MSTFNPPCVPKTKSRLSYAILLLLSLSFIATTASTQGLPVNTLLATIQLGADVYPQAVVVSPDSQTIYVGSLTPPRGGLVSVIDSQTETITTTIPLANGVSALASTPDGSTLYALSLSNPAAVFVISTASKSVTATLDMQGVYLAVSRDGRHVYVTDGFQGISIIDTATNRVHLNVIRTPKANSTIALTPDESTAYVSIGDAVVAIDLASRQVTARIPLANNNALPSFLTVSPNGKRLFINTGKHPVHKGSHNLLLVVDTITNQVIKSIEPTAHFTEYGQPAITPDGKFLYVPVGNVLMMDTVTKEIVGNPINLGVIPPAVAVAATAPFACAIGLYGNNDEGELYLIDISPE
jgi:DNA-binding beta-propeller fold protein YncE